MKPSVNTDDRVLRIKQVIAITGLSKTALYEAIKSKDFPPPLKLSIRSSGWLLSDVTSFLQKKADARAEVNNG